MALLQSVTGARPGRLLGIFLFFFTPPPRVIRYCIRVPADDQRCTASFFEHQFFESDLEEAGEVR